MKPQTQTGSALDSSSPGVRRGLPVVAGAVAGDRVWSTAVVGRAAVAVGWFNDIGAGWG